MPQEEEEDNPQRTQKALEEKFWRQYEIDVALMSQGNEMQDRMDAQERMNEDAGEDFLDMTDEDFLDTHMVYVPRPQNAPVNALKEVELKREEFVESPRIAPVSRQQRIAPIPPTAPVNAQAQATTISSVEFLKALKEIAFNCDLLDEFKKIETEEAKLQNKNLHIPISFILFNFGGYLAEISYASKASGPQEGQVVTASLFVLKLGNMDRSSQKIKELENRSRNKSTSMDTIREHVESLWKLAVPEA